MKRRRENRGAEGAEEGGVWGIPLASGRGVWGGGSAPFFDFFVWQWCILVHSGRLF